MGMDLKLFPIECPYGDADWYVRNVLEVAREDRVFDLVRALPRRPLIPRVKLYIPGRAWCRTDLYGDALGWVRAEELAELGPRLPSDVHPWTRAALDYLAALPADTVVVLYWC